MEICERGSESYIYIYWAVFSKEQVSIDIREMIKSRFFAATKRFHIHRDFKIFSRPPSPDLNTINRAFPDLSLIFFFFKYEFILLSSLLYICTKKLIREIIIIH